MQTKTGANGVLSINDCSYNLFLHSEGNSFWILGSKNRHFVVGDLSELYEPRLEEEEKFSVGLAMARHFVENTTEAQQLSIHNYCLETKHTIVLEHIDPSNQHMILYEHTQLFFLGINDHHDVSKTGLLAVSPLAAFKLFKSWGLSVPEHCLVPVEDVSTKIEKDIYFETKVNAEGAVVYMLRGETCIGMYKHKNHDYIKFRAVREQIRNRRSLADLRKRLTCLHVPVSEEEIDVYVR